MPSESCGAPFPEHLPRKRLLWEALELTCERTKGHSGDHSTAPEPVSEIKVLWPSDGIEVRPDNPDVICMHGDTEASVEVTHLSDSGRSQADIKIRCTACGEDFLWPEALVVGISLSGVARSLDAKELRIAITPESQRAAEEVFRR